MITQNLTPAEFESAKEKLALLGIVVPEENSGTVSHEGASVAFTYDGKVLTLNVVHTLPFTHGLVVGKLIAGLKIATPNEPVSGN